MEVSALFPLLAFVVPYLVARQMISSATSQLDEHDRLALFPIGRARARLTWLALPIIVAIYLAKDGPAILMSLAAGIIFILGIEIFQLVQVRKLVAAAEFKRKHSIATAIACSGVFLAIGALVFERYAP